MIEQYTLYTLLSERLLVELRTYWKIECPRPWMFPGSKANRPMSSGTAQKIYHQARRRVGIEQGSGIHTLRHSFATHLFDADEHAAGIPLSNPLPYMHPSSLLTLRYSGS